MLNKEAMSDNDFESLLNEYDYKFQKGDLVKGVVIGYDPENVIVDIGAKTNAMVPNREAVVDADNDNVKDTLKKGCEYEFLIVRNEDEEGEFILSYKKVALAYNWKELEALKEEDATVTGKVLSSVKGGVLVEVMGVRGFVPSSHLKTRDIQSVIGETLEFKILTMDASQNNFILSNKKVYSDQNEGDKIDLFEKLEVGQIVEGEVVRITDFGAFVDIGGIDGLIPLSQMSWKWVDHPGDILKVNTTIKVEVIGIDPDKHRISLSLKNLEPDPWELARDTIKEGEKIEGVVTRIKHFGAFVEVADGVEALLPTSEINDYQNENSCILSVGDKIITTVIKFNPDDRRVSLSVTNKTE